MKMNKKLWKGFFMNLLSVILGIILTFGGNAIWQKNEEKKKIREMLILVRNELEINKEWFKDQEKNIRRDSYAYQKILEAEGDWSTIHPDTINEYKSQTRTFTYGILTSSAWQIFQSSEVIQKMTDKELVIGIMNSYAVINLIHGVIMEEYWNAKKKAVAFENDPYRYFETVMNNKETVSFYRRFSPDQSNFWDVFSLIDDVIDQMLMLLDNHGNYRYGKDEDNNRVETSVEAEKDSVCHKKDTIQKEIANQ